MQKLSILLLAALFQVLNAQTGKRVPFVNKSDVFGTRNFVENRGQFDHHPAGSDILFALENGDERVYFTPGGLVYELVKAPRLRKRDIEALERDPHYKLKETEKYYVKMEWLGANPRPETERYELQPHYMTYGASHLNSRTYKRIVFRDVYPGIDFEYTLPEARSAGFKYNVIVHPGADASLIKMRYSGDITSSEIDKEGNVVIGTKLDRLTEFAPESFHADGKKVATAFRLNGDVLGFSFPEGYNRSQTLVIDPWVTPIAFLTSNQYAYDVDYDFNGNTYVYGGYGPFKVSRYSPAGTIQWTFAGTVTTPAWSSAPIPSQASNFAVNKYNGKTYIGQGYVGSGNRVIRLDASGNYDNFINAANPNFQEVWDMGFHCTNDGEVFVLGGGVSSNISAVTINPTTAVITLATFQPTNNSIAQDVVSHAIDDAGKIFVIYAGAQVVNNKMSLVNAAFNNNVWTEPTGFMSFSEQGNKSAYSGVSLSSNGFNALAVNGNYLYYYDGKNLGAYSKTTGLPVGTAIQVPGLTLKKQGGIAVDDCNNLYLGGDNSIITYNFNGTTFSTLTPIALNQTATVNSVFDIKLDKPSKLLYVAGSGFVGTWQAANSLACPTASSICFSYQLLDHMICAGSSVTLSSSSSNTLSNPSYTLLPGPTVNTTGSFVVSPTVTTSYTIYGTGVNTSSGTVTYSAVSNVSVFPNPLVAPSVTQANCYSDTSAFNLNLSWNPSSATPTYVVNWSPVPNGVTSSTQTAARGIIAPGVYNATVSTQAGCTAVATFTIVGPPAVPKFVIAPAGPYLLTCKQPVLTLSYTPATHNYTTNNQVVAAQTGPNPVFTFTNIQGTITATAEHPQSGCILTQTFTIAQNSVAPSSTVAPLYQNIDCKITSITTVTAYANPATNIEHQWISSLGPTLTANSATATFNPGMPGVYKHCLVNVINGCSTCKTFTVFSSDSFPTFQIVSSPPGYTLGCSSKSVATISIVNAQTTPPGGVVSFTMLAPGMSVPSPSLPLLSQNVYSVTTAGSYTFITRDKSNSCDSKIFVSVLSNTFAPSLDSLIVPRTMLDCDNPSVVLEGISNTPNTSYLWRLPGGNLAGNTMTATANAATPNATLLATYTLQLTDNNNLCVANHTVRINQNLFPPNVLISGGDRITCKTETISLINQSSSNVPEALTQNKPVIAIQWYGPSPQVPMQFVSSYVGYMPGTYTLIAKDLNNGCVGTATRNVLDKREYPNVNRPEAPAPFVLDCGQLSRTITPILTSTASAFSYSWIPAPGATVTGQSTGTLSTNTIGRYDVIVTNEDNGCFTAAAVEVISGTLQADFEPSVVSGFAPLAVTFSNTSVSSLGTGSITSVWGFGNGSTSVTPGAHIIPETIYTQAGTYSVVLFSRKGGCLDSMVKTINVELPSTLEIPNIFSPNGDDVNDIFFVKGSNIAEIEIRIWDRWGKAVYELSTDKGNVAWDGKNMQGKTVPDGVYMYVLKATGRDGVQYDRKGNITLVR